MKTNIRLLKWRREHEEYHMLRLVGFVSKDKKENMELWLSENCSFNWDLYFAPFRRSYCAFENQTDAMAFKLRWL